MKMIGGRRRLVVAAVVAVILVAVVATAALAQTPTPGTESNGQGVKYGQVFLDKLAALLNIDRSKLDSAIKDAGKQTADEAVKNGDLTQSQADKVKERIDQGQPGWFGMPGCFGKMGRPFFDGLAGKALIAKDTVVKAVADKLGMTVDDLQAAFKSGKSLADLEKDKGISDQDLRAAVADAVKPQLDQAVADGKMTQKQADSIIDSIKNGKFPMMLGWGRGHWPEGRPWFKKGTPTPNTAS